MKTWGTFIFVAFIGTLTGCESEKFRSNGTNGGSDAVALYCNVRGNQAPQTVRADFGHNAVIDATLCPSLNQNQASPLQVVFLIDFSGSMTIADPVENGQCDRMRAASVVTQNYLAALSNPAAVQFSVISFDMNANTLSAHVPGTSFNSNDQNLFCGAVTPPKGHNNTNYESALQQAYQLLQTKPNADKRIYFLSDGRPSVSTNMSSDGAGKTALEISRLATQDTIPKIKQLHTLSLTEIYALFLDWNSDTEQEFEIEPFDLMSQITNNAANVKVVDNSSQLPVLIQDLTPQAGKMVSPSQILIEVRAEGFEKRTFQADPSTFIWDGNPATPITFKTQAMQLFGQPGQIVRNQVTISARDSRFSSVVFYIDWDQT